MIGGYKIVGTGLSMLPSQALIGYYRYFNAHNIPVNFISLQTLTKGNPSQYKLIIAPYSLMFTKKAAKALKEYVRKGGHLIGEARMGWNNKQGDASEKIPGLGLAKLFGVQEAKIRKHNKVSIKVTDGKTTITRGLKGDSLTGAIFAESLKLLSDVNHKVKVLAAFEDGTPAITVTQVGKGKALYIGSFIGLARERFPESLKNNDQLLHNLLNWANVQLPFTAPGVNGENVEVRLQKNQNNGDYLLFIINHTKKDQSASIHLNLDNLHLNSSHEISLSELTGNKKTKENPSGDTLTLHTSLSKKGVQVWLIQPSK